MDQLLNAPVDEHAKTLGGAKGIDAGAEIDNLFRRASGPPGQCRKVAAMA
jgi:hypothetical protein